MYNKTSWTKDARKILQPWVACDPVCVWSRHQLSQHLRGQRPVNYRAPNRQRACIYNKCSNVKSRGRPNDINFFSTFLSPYSSRPSIMQRAVGTRRSSSAAMPRLIELTSITRWIRHFIPAVFGKYAPTPRIHVNYTRLSVYVANKRYTGRMWPLFLHLTVTTHVLHLWSLLLANLPAPLWKSLIAPLGMLHRVYGTNSPLIFASLVRHSLLHFLLSHMAVHHFHHLHDHHLHLLLLAHYFILKSTLGCSANPFLHRTFPFLPDWFHGPTDHLPISLWSTAVFVCMVC